MFLIAPVSIGAGLLLGLPSFALILYGLVRWYRQGWSLAPPLPSAKSLCAGRTCPRATCSAMTCCFRQASPVILALGVAFVLVVLLETIIALGGGSSGTGAAGFTFSYLALSWAMLGANAACMIMAVHALTRPDPRYNVVALVRSATALGKRGPDAVGAALKGKPSEDGAPWLLPSAKGVPGAAAAFYAASLVFLAALAGIVAVLAETGRQDQGPFLGITTAAAILLADVTTLLAWRGGLVTSTGTISVVVLLCRALVIAPGARFWLLGHSFVYLVLGLFLASRVVATYFSSTLLESGSESGRAAPCGGIFGPGCAVRGCLVGTLTAPGTILLAVTAVFTALIAAFFVLLRSSNAFPDEEVSVFGRRQPQWTYGLGALLLVFAYLGAHFTLVQRRRSGGLLTTRPAVVAALCSVAGIAGLGGLIFAGTTSYVLLACTTFVPAVVVILLGVYGQWQRDDYALAVDGGFGWCFCCCPRGHACGPPAADGDDAADPVVPAAGATAPGGDEAPAARSTAGTPAPAAAADAEAAAPAADAAAPADPAPAGSSAFASMLSGAAAATGATMRSGATGCCAGGRGRNNAMTVAVVVAVGLVIAFAAVFNLGLRRNEYGWMASLEILSLATAFFAARKWFGTLDWHWFVPAGIAASLALHIGAFAPLVAAAFSDPAEFPGRVPLGIVFGFAMVPFVVLLGTALYKWSDDRWEPSLLVYVCLALSQLAIIGFGVAGVLVFDEPVLVAALLAGYVTLSCAVALAVTAAVNGGWIPPAAEYAMLGLLALLVLAGVAMAGLEGAAARYTNSLGFAAAAWFLVAVALGLAGILGVVRRGALEADPFSAIGSGRGSQGALLSATDDVFPVFRLSPATSQLVPTSSPVVWVVTSLLMVLAFGLVIAVFVQPVYVGLILAAIAKGLLLVFTLEVGSKSQERLAKACEIIDAIDSRKRARKSDLEASTAGPDGSGGVAAPPPPADAAAAAAALAVAVGSPALLAAVGRALARWGKGGAGGASVLKDAEADAAAASDPRAVAATLAGADAAPTVALRLAIARLEEVVEHIEGAAGLRQLAIGCVGGCGGAQPAAGAPAAADGAAAPRDGADAAAAGAEGGSKAPEAGQAAAGQRCCGPDTGRVPVSWRDDLAAAIRAAREASAAVTPGDSSGAGGLAAMLSSGLAAATGADRRAEAGSESQGTTEAAVKLHEAVEERAAGGDDDDDAKTGETAAAASAAGAAAAAAPSGATLGQSTSNAPGETAAAAAAAGAKTLSSQLEADLQAVLAEAEDEEGGGVRTSVLLAAGWEALEAADRALAHASMSEQAFLAGVRLSVVGQGMMAAAEERSQWRSFLVWCTDVAEAVADLASAADSDAAKAAAPGGAAAPSPRGDAPKDLDVGGTAPTRAGWVDESAQRLTVEQGRALVEIATLHRAAQRDSGLRGEAARKLTASFEVLRSSWRSGLADAEADRREAVLSQLRLEHWGALDDHAVEQREKRLQEEAAEARRRQIADEEMRRRQEEEAGAERRQAEAKAAEERAGARAREEAERRRAAEVAKEAADRLDEKAAAEKAKLDEEAKRREAAAAAARLAEASAAAAAAKDDRSREAAKREAAAAREAKRAAEAAADALKAEAEAAARSNAAMEVERQRRQAARKAREKAEAAKRADAEAAREQAEAVARRQADEQRSKDLEAAERRSKQAAAGADFFVSRAKQVKEELRKKEAAVTSARWVDSSFEGAAARYGDPSKKGKHDKYQPWRHYSEAVPKAALTKQDFGADDLVQGSLGDCWLIAAIAVVAQRPDLMERIFPVRESPKGVWPVELCFNREWTTMWVDDRFPMWVDGLTSKGKPLKGSVYVTAPDQEEMWPCLLEKAYAKFYGSYSIIDGGQSHNALSDLTGGLADKWDVADKKAEVASGELWTKLKVLIENQHLVACGSHSGSDTTRNKNGIVQGHAFSVLDARDCNDGRGNSLRMVKVRNPHGRSEWTGRYSDEDEPHWTSRLKKEMSHDPDASGDDGTWCMLFEDFVENFRNVYICRILTPFDAATGKGWHIYTATGAWSKGSTAGGCLNYPSAVTNPQWVVRPSKPCSAFFSVRLVEAEGSSRDYTLHIGLKVLAKQGRRARRALAGEERAGSSFSNAREEACEAQLTPEQLTILPSTFYPEKEAAFVLTVATSEALQASSAGPLVLLDADAPSD